jgi:hypothetical protein
VVGLCQYPVGAIAWFAVGYPGDTRLQATSDQSERVVYCWDVDAAGDVEPSHFESFDM